MTTIRLLDARRGLNLKCRELFKDDKIAEAIYRYLCDGIEECEDAEPEPITGKWLPDSRYYDIRFVCSECKKTESVATVNFKPVWKYCPNCGARMEKFVYDKAVEEGLT